MKIKYYYSKIQQNGANEKEIRKKISESIKKEKKEERRGELLSDDLMAQGKWRNEGRSGRERRKGLG